MLGFLMIGALLIDTRTGGEDGRGSDGGNSDI